MLKQVLLTAALVASASADMYMQNPRGSNDRCDAQDDNRQNANRLFDSQNNAAGGYTINADYQGDSFTPFYYEESDLELRWTNQHSCGPNNHCEVVLQYACEHNFDAKAPNGGNPIADADPAATSGPVRDGESQNAPADGDDNNGSTCTDTIPDNAATTKDAVYGRHESNTYWDNCQVRPRNHGLWGADQVGQNNSNNQEAVETRQDNTNNGNRHGFECPEERDYYPYWHPTPFVDIAILTSSTDRCDYYKEESQNVKAKGYCKDPAFNNLITCEGANQGDWTSFPSWESFYESNDLTRGSGVDKLVCQQAPSSLLNRLGAGVQSGSADAKPTALDGNHQSFVWSLPKVPFESSADQEDDQDEEGNDIQGSGFANLKACVLRMRYNITVNEVPFDADFRNNTTPNTVTPGSLLYENPYHEIHGRAVRHAINTDQAGRTFQDRSHTFDIKKRGDGVVSGGDKIHNLNRCGKRGNIQEVRNCIEFEFCPSVMTISENDVLHIQFSGSDFHDQGNAGQGAVGTERSSIVQVEEHKNFKGMATSTIFNEEDAIFLARPNHPADGEGGCTSDRYGFPFNQRTNEDNNNGNADQQDNNCAVLNGGDDASIKTPFVNRIVTDFQSTGTFYFKDMRNNNFSNRGQGLEIKVNKAGLSDAQIAGIVVGSIVGAVAIAACVGVLVMKNNNPDFQLKDVFSNKV